MATLRELIDTEPANASRTDREVLEWLWAPVAEIGRISTKKLHGWAVEDDIAGILEAKLMDGNATVRGLARGFLAIMRYQETFDVADPQAQTYLATSVALGVLTQRQVDALYALASNNSERWRVAKVPEPRMAHVQSARGGR